MKVHLINAGKYFSDLCVPLAGLFIIKYDFNTSYYIYIAIHAFASTYSYAWDIYMDWGLLRQNDVKKPNYLLREKCNYQPIFYYYAIISDLILRFTWVITLWSVGKPDTIFTNF